MVAVLILSLILQLGAVALALRLLRSREGTARARRAWAVFSGALVLMWLRRFVTLIGFQSPALEPVVKGPLAEFIALAIALLMLIGVAQITTVFRELGATVAALETSLGEQRRVEASLRATEERLRHSQKLEAIGRLAGGIAHDFNNVLTAIAGYSDLALARLQNGVVRDHVEEIRRSGERAAALTRQLLAFSRKQVLIPKVLDLNTVVADMNRMLSRLIGEEIDLTTDLALDLGRVRADRGQLEQVLVNLVVNAREAMAGGGRLTVATKNCTLSADQAGDGLPPGRYVALCVTDTGAGFTAEAMTRLFEPFHTTKTSGTGLGLATVYGIVRQSGGDVTVESKSEHGATIRVILPRTDEPLTPAEPSTPSVTRATDSSMVLVVEDEDLLRPMIREVLESGGYRVIEARDGREGLEIMERRSTEVDLILTDLVMPHMGGIDLVQRLRNRGLRTPVVFMSGHANLDPGASEAIGLTNAFLPKPFSPDVLLAQVRRALV